MLNFKQVLAACKLAPQYFRVVLFVHFIKHFVFFSRLEHQTDSVQLASSFEDSSVGDYLDNLAKAGPGGLHVGKLHRDKVSDLRVVFAEDVLENGRVEAVELARQRLWLLQLCRLTECWIRFILLDETNEGEMDERIELELDGSMLCHQLHELLICQGVLVECLRDVEVFEGFVELVVLVKPRVNIQLVASQTFHSPFVDPLLHL